MADQYTPTPNVPAGGTDTSDRYGPTVSGGGDNPATQPGYLTATTGDATYPTGPSAAGIEVPRAVFHNDAGGYVVHSQMTADSSNAPPVTDRDGDDGLPDIPRYEGPSVADQAAVVNPSAGTQGPTEQGLADVNPTGPTFGPGDVPASDTRQVYPDTTQDTYPR
jgi:hypothetical protein